MGMTDETKTGVEGTEPVAAPVAKIAVGRAKPDNVTIAEANPMTLRYDCVGAEVKAKFFKRYPAERVRTVPGYHKLTLAEIASILG